VGVTALQAAIRRPDDPMGPLGAIGAELVEGFDGYADVTEIGRGGFGVVYRARQLDGDRWVALKVLTGTVDDQAARRFERERAALAALAGHPAVVRLHGWGRTWSGAPFLVMELLAGGSLADVVRREGPLPADVAVDLVLQICGAIESAHATGVLHRDIKPDNVLLDDHGRAKLVDFGMATGVTGVTTATTGVTATVGHAAPEVLVGNPASPRSEVYSLGSTLFALLAGHPAFVRPTDDSFLPVLARIGLDPVPDLRVLGVPDAVAAVVEQAMAKEPAQRHASVAELGDALRATRRGAARRATHRFETRSAWVPSTVALPIATRLTLGPPAPPRVGLPTTTRLVILAETTGDEPRTAAPLPLPARLDRRRTRPARRSRAAQLAVGVAATVAVLLAASGHLGQGVGGDPPSPIEPAATVTAPDPVAAARIVTEAAPRDPTSDPAPHSSR
jgi:serine/threonine protein kinase